MEIKQNRCDNCIHYQKQTKKIGCCETNVVKIFATPLFDKNGKEKKFHITTKCSNYCDLYVEKIL